MPTVKMSDEAFKRLREWMYDHECRSYSEALHDIFEELSTAQDNLEAQENENDKLVKMIEELGGDIDEIEDELREIKAACGGRSR